MMRHKRLQSRVTTGRWTLPLILFVCTLCWVPTALFVPALTDANRQLLPTVALPAWGEQVLSFLLYIGVGYLLIELNNRFGIIRMRASMQTGIYFLLVTVCPSMHLLHVGHVAALATLFSIYFLFRAYHEPLASGRLFHSFFFIGLGSILFPPLTLLAPLWVLEAYRFRTLTLRSFCASALGWALPYWFLLGHAFFYAQMELFYRPFREIAPSGQLLQLDLLQPWQLAVLGYLLLLFAVSAMHCIVASHEDKIRSRTYLQFLIDLSLFLFLFIALQPTLCNELLPSLLMSSSMLIGHYFVLTDSRASNLFFLTSLAGLILLFAFNLWTLL